MNESWLTYRLEVGTKKRLSKYEIYLGNSEFPCLDLLLYLYYMSDSPNTKKIPSMTMISLLILNEGKKQLKWRSKVGEFSNKLAN